MTDWNDDLIDQVNELKAEIEALRAENERLRGVLEKVDHWINRADFYNKVYGQDYHKKLIDEVSAALDRCDD